MRRDLTKVQPGGRIESIGVLEAEISPRRTAGPFMERAMLNLASLFIQTVVWPDFFIACVSSYHDTAYYTELLRGYMNRKTAALSCESSYPKRP